VRPLAINLYAVIAKLFCRANEFRQSESFAAIPAAEVGNVSGGANVEENGRFEIPVAAV
jgi:hypothetical protein